MSNWCEYWSKSRLIKLNDREYRLVNENDSLDFFIDGRNGRTYGMIYLFGAPGTKGSTIARGEEAVFLEEMINGKSYA